MVHSSKPNSSCIFNNIPSNCFKTHKQVQMLYTRDIAASFQVLTPHGVPLDNKQPKSQRSKRWCDSILLISFIDILDLLKWVKIDFFYQEFQCFNEDRVFLKNEQRTGNRQSDKNQTSWRIRIEWYCKNPFVEPLISFVA